MADLWQFGEPEHHETKYADGTIVPHYEIPVFVDGREIGYLEVHMHKRYGRDKRRDVSFGVTAVVYGPVEGGN